MLPLVVFAETQTEAPSDFKVAVETKLVLRSVSVKDGDGKPIEGLTEDDFILTEDGTPQTIAICEFQTFDTSPLPPIRPRSILNRGVEPVSLVGQRQFSTARSGRIKYQNRRLLVLFFDLMTMTPADRYRAFVAGRTFIRSGMAAPDLMAIMVFSKSVVRILMDFTDDRERLDQAIQTLIAAENEGDDLTEPDTVAAFGQSSGEFNLFNTDRQLAALQTAVTLLGALNERKSFIYFAAGLRLNGMDNQAQLRATINSAVRANVAFYPIDARGLVVEAPLGDATKSSPGGIAMFTGAAAIARMSDFQESQDTLFALASNTGGKATLDNNNLSEGIAAAQQAVSSYYLLGYYTTNPAADGKFRRIRIELSDKRKAHLDYRQGYYAEKKFQQFTKADKERQLEEALMLEDPITELTMSMEVNYFKLNSAEYYVPVTVKIPGSELLRARDTGSDRALIDLIGEVRDDYGSVYANMRDRISFKLKGETAEALSGSPIQFDCGFTLLPGKYIIKMLARNAETGRMGTYLTAFTIPNLMKERRGLPISSVVLSSQKIDMRRALYTAGKDKAQLANPLVINGLKLVPSVSRVFNRAREMHVYLHAYEQNAVSTEPLVVVVALFKGGKKAYETPALAVAEGLHQKSKAVPVLVSVRLDALQPGEYDCHVTVLDPTNRKAAFWQAPIMLIQ